MSGEDEVMALIEKLVEAAYGNGHEAGCLRDHVSRVNELPMEVAIRERLERFALDAYARGRSESNAALYRRALLLACEGDDDKAAFFVSEAGQA